MNTRFKILIVLIVIVITPVIIGLFQPRDRIVIEKGVIDKLYFYILSDVTNHWEESQWRSNIDTITQMLVIDGQDAWVEYYNNGDSVMLISQKTTETDYIRLIIEEDRNFNRVISIKDFDGKTAIRIAEEASEGNPIKRFALLFNDPVRDRLKLYLADLKEKNKPDPNAAEEDTDW